MFFASKYFINLPTNTKINTIHSKNASFVGNLTPSRKKIVDLVKNAGICVEVVVEKSQTDLINVLSDASCFTLLIPRTYGNIVEIHRLASIICASTPAVAIYKNISSSIPYLTLLSDVLTITSSDEYFVKKCIEFTQTNLDDKIQHNIKWWEKQQVTNIVSDILTYCENNINNNVVSAPSKTTNEFGMVGYSNVKYKTQNRGKQKWVFILLLLLIIFIIFIIVVSKWDRRIIK